MSWAKIAPPIVPTQLKQLQDRISAGLQRYGSPPIATMSGQLAQAGLDVQKRGGDPLLPTILTMKETSGLKNPASQKLNNPAGVGPGIQYPNLPTAILGGGKQIGLRGVLMSKPYDNYYKSGNIADFYKTYTPPVPGNPSLDAQISTHNQLRSYFK